MFIAIVTAASHWSSW